MTGTLYGVGVGPGEAELMTLKAVRIIRACELIAVPKSGDGERVALNIAKSAVPEVEEKELLELSMPMTRDKALLEKSHREAADLVCEKLREGKNIAFLTLGDPTVYSTYIYVHNLVKKQGFEPVIVPGIPSFCAVAARLSTSLTEASQPLHIIPASYEGTEDYLSLTGTKVLMKTGKSLEKVREMLKEKGLYENARMVQNCGMADEKVYEKLDDADAGYFSIIVVK